MECRKSKPRILTFLDLTALGIGNSVGIGIFVLLGDITKNVTGPAVIISILLSALAALLAGLCFAEFATRFFKADTAYIYSYACHSENVSFLLGWALILKFLAGSASAAKGIIIFIDALAENQISKLLQNLFSVNSDYGFFHLDFFSPIILLILMIPLACGMKDSTPVKNLFTLFTVLLLFSIIAAGLFKANPSNWYLDKHPGVEKLERSFAPFGFLGVLKGAAICFYGFVGFETIGVSGKEVGNPQKYLPFATYASLCIVLAVYLGAGSVLTLISPYTKINEGAALPFAFGEINWIALKWIIAVGAFLGFYTSSVGEAFPLPRIIHSMAGDGLLFSFLSRKHSQWETPLAAIVTAALLSAIAAAIFTFQILVNLTIFGTLFVSTILAIDVIVLRYEAQAETTGTDAERMENFFTSKSGISMKHLMGILFHFNSNIPTKIVQKIVAVNLAIFCIFSVALALVFAFFSDYLIQAAVQAVLPAAIFLALMLFTMASMAFQPKSQSPSPFKIPLIPFLPCLSIFLNVLLMSLLGPLTVIFFLIWMVTGVLLHFLRRAFFKYWHGDLGKNFLFEINKSNSLKLSESIWKINCEKNTFYEGAANPVFEKDEFDPATKDEGVKEREETNEKGPFRFRSEDSISFEKVQKNFKKNKSPILEHSPLRGETVQWECAAEIHPEDGFSQESYELQVVDHTYEFLTRIMEDTNQGQNRRNSEEKFDGPNQFSEEEQKDIEEASPETSFSAPEMAAIPKSTESSQRECDRLFAGQEDAKKLSQSENQTVTSEGKAERRSERDLEKMSMTERKNGEEDEISERKTKEIFFGGEESNRENLVGTESISQGSEKMSANGKSEEVDNRTKLIVALKENKEREKSDEKGKFKEKLNLILKNQINEIGRPKGIKNFQR